MVEFLEVLLNKTVQHVEIYLDVHEVDEEFTVPQVPQDVVGKVEGLLLRDSQQDGGYYVVEALAVPNLGEHVTQSPQHILEPLIAELVFGEEDVVWEGPSDVKPYGS